MTVLLSVQFRNLLPSEELLRSARSMWSALDLRASAPTRESGDAHLSITQRSDLPCRFEVELSVPGADNTATACGDDAQLAIESVFRQFAQRESPSAELTLRFANFPREASAIAKVSG